MGICFERICICCILYATLFYNTANAKQCSVLLDKFFSKCNTREGELEDFRNDELNRVYTLNISDLKNSTECSDDAICRRIFRIGRIRKHSFSTKTLVQISYMLAQCCGACAKYHRTDLDMEQFVKKASHVQGFDIVYPVVAQATLDSLYGYHFLPVFNVPSAFYLTLKKSELQIARDIFMECLNKWSLFVMCIALSIIAGAVGWLAECRTNSREFPKNFYLGLYEGFWWSFISMTTVGYGDRIPKSVFGRLFAVIWILTGITMTTIFTATLTIEIMDHDANDKTIQIQGKSVGILKYRLHDAIMVAQHGGIAHEIEFESTVHGVRDLYELLWNKEVDGVLISRSTFYFFSRMIRESDHYKDVYTRSLEIPLKRVEKHFKEDKPVVGMLVRKKGDCDYFRTYFEANWFQIQSCYLYSLNYKNKKFNGTMIPVTKDNSKSNPAFYGTFGILCVIIVFGSIFEAVKYFLKTFGKEGTPVSNLLIEDSMNNNVTKNIKEPL